MRKLYILLIVLLSLNVKAQTPLTINYQGLARHNNGTVISNHLIAIKLSILSGSVTGNSVYMETHLKNTDAYGLFNLQIGQGTIFSGTFSAINWGDNSYFLKIEMDLTGDTNYQLVGINQFASVPYALFAANSNFSLTNQMIGDMLYFDGNKWVRLPKGNKGQLLTLDSLGIPSWQNQQFKPPSATIQAATNITYNSGTLNGIVNANGFNTFVSFEYGSTTNYGTTVASIQNTVNGYNNSIVNCNISSLTIDTTYHYRLKISNAVDVVYSDDMMFTPVAQIPSANTISSSNYTNTGVTLRGEVNAKGLNTTVIFEFDTNTNYNNTVLVSQSPITGISNNIITVNITGLAFGKIYHYRVKATNALGTSYGEDKQFVYLYNGASYQGGLVFYIDTTSPTGMICTSTDLSTGSIWGCSGTVIGTSAGIGLGLNNTLAIIANCSTSGIAARICYNSILNGYDDWVLPSNTELGYIHSNLVLKGYGNFIKGNYYWSSTEGYYNSADVLYYDSFMQYWTIEGLAKTNLGRVRAIRYF